MPLAAQVGGIGIAPRCEYRRRMRTLFEATHGTARNMRAGIKSAEGSIILSAEMMLRHMRYGLKRRI